MRTPAPLSPLSLLSVAIVACAPTGEAPRPADSTPVQQLSTPTAERWCASLPRAANAALPKAPVSSDWFEIYRVDSGVYAFVESRQFQEVISYLIVGTKSALLFDTGLGMAPIRPLVERLTTRPVRVLNSHTHYDHVGGNAEFTSVLAMDTPYTRANQRGFPHGELAGEVAASAFCGAPPATLDTSTYRTRPWSASRRLADGDTIDLGGRVLEVLGVPGHTPDAVALLDRADSLLFTGDTYYDAPVWLYVPETDLDAYERSIDRLTSLAPQVKSLLTAHNTAVADPARLTEMGAAIRQVRAGTLRGKDEGDQRVTFAFGHFSILTSTPLLQKRSGDRTRGGSGLTTWP